ncbi:MAG: diphthamide biosynthesis enzyme Dph2 [archaeon]|nr:diphthamide biosynthesis enzyme Dph2 [archaeon]
MKLKEDKVSFSEMFDLQLEYVATWIRAGKYHSVALQMPEGLKSKATEIVDFLTINTNADFVISGDPCYGSCDILYNFKDLADALVHFGHSPIPGLQAEEDVLFVKALCHPDIKENLKKNINIIPEKIGLLTTLQYIECIEQAKEILEKHGKKVVIEKGDRRTCYPGQILGCNCSSAESASQCVDAFIFIGEGNFHPLTVALHTGKKVLVFNPFTGELKDIDTTKDRILRRRFAVIQDAKDAKRFLVIVCSKIGQKRNTVADNIIKEIQRSGKIAYKAYMNELIPQNLIAYHVDAFVSTACPRIAIDDYSRYSKPILTPMEAEIALGLKKWDEYTFDAIRSIDH